jgi:hypothetical protein
MDFNIREKFNSFWTKHIVREFDVETMLPNKLHQLYFNIHTKNPDITRAQVADALTTLEFSKRRYGVDPVLDNREIVEKTIKDIIDNAKKAKEQRAQEIEKFITIMRGGRPEPQDEPKDEPKGEPKVIPITRTYPRPAGGGA